MVYNLQAPGYWGRKNIVSVLFFDLKCKTMPSRDYCFVPKLSNIRNFAPRLAEQCVAQIIFCIDGPYLS